MSPALTELIALAKSAAQKHSLDIRLVCAVADHESSWNPWALRYEPAFYAHYEETIKNITATEAHCRALSWGLMQIMGQTAREFGFAGVSLGELLDPATGIEYGCRKLAHCVENAKDDTRAALLFYNGGSDPKYPDLVLPLMAKYPTV